MVKWMREWFILSALMVLGMGMLFMLWLIWPLLPARLPAEMLASLNFEGLIAILMLFIVVMGFGKLMRGH